MKIKTKMDCFIKKIFEDKSDELVHLQFQKFSRGNFAGKAIFKASKNAKGFSLATGPEYANELVRSLAEKLGKNKTKVSGPIITTQKLKEMPLFHKLLADVNIKQFAGVKQHVIDTELSGEELVHYLNAAPDAFFALSMAFDNIELKTKPKMPKSSKPSTSDKPAVPDFCKLKTADEHLIHEFVFEKGWKKIEGTHVFAITDIILPKGVTDVVEIRKQAKRKGKIIRKTTIDDHQSVKEKDFLA